MHRLLCVTCALYDREVLLFRRTSLACLTPFTVKYQIFVSNYATNIVRYCIWSNQESLVVTLNGDVDKINKQIFFLYK